MVQKLQLNWAKNCNWNLVKNCNWIWEKNCNCNWAKNCNCNWEKISNCNWASKIYNCNCVNENCTSNWVKNCNWNWAKKFLAKNCSCNLPRKCAQSASEFFEENERKKDFVLSFLFGLIIKLKKLHRTEKSFRNLIKSNRNLIVITKSMEENVKYNLISVWFTKISKRFSLLTPNRRALVNHGTHSLKPAGSSRHYRIEAFKGSPKLFPHDFESNFATR